MDDMTLKILAFAGATVISLLIWNLKRTVEARDEKIENIENDIHIIKESLPKDYVQKTDYKSDMNEIKYGIKEIRDFIFKKQI